MPNVMHPTVAAVLPKFEEHFRFKLLHLERGDTLGLTRTDLSIHCYSHFPPGDPEPDFFEARRWLEQHGVMFVRYPRQDGQIGYFLAPIIPIPLIAGFHATPRKNWEKIRNEGLLPGDPTKGQASTGIRFDCEGYIFVCEKLGVASDAGVPFSYSAHWWLNELRGKSSDPDWVILEVELSNFRGLLTNRDVCSDSGVILSGVERIPPERIKLAWPESMGT